MSQAHFEDFSNIEFHSAQRYTIKNRVLVVEKLQIGIEIKD